MQAWLHELDECIADHWARIKQGAFWQHCLAQPVDRDLYRRVMEQIYHYTRYNSINQAAAALRADPGQHQLLRFVYRHALEELGHENMVVHDLRSIGLLDPTLETRRPLPPTRALIAYLNDVALSQGPVARLGYSYWAEDSYLHIGEILDKARRDLGLGERNLSFFIAHAEIDAGHAEAVRSALHDAVQDPRTALAVREVAETTLYLTGQVLDYAYQTWGGAGDADGAGRVAAG